MPRIIHVDTLAHFGLEETEFTFCWIVTPPGGEPEGYTGLDVDVQVGTVLCESTANVLPTAVPSSIGLDIDGVDVQLLWDQAAAFNLERVEARQYDGSLVDLYAIPWAMFLATPGLGLEYAVPLISGRLGTAQITDEAAKFELLPWSSLTNTTVGRMTNDRCDCPRFGRGRCMNLVLQDGIQIALHGRTVAGTVVDAPEFSANAMHFHLDLEGTRPDGWANWGVLRFTSGPNSGAEVPVKLWRETGEVFLRTPAPEIPQPGDTIELEEGCERSRAACLTKEPDPDNPTGKGNIINFQGFGTPGQALLAKASESS